MSEIQKGLEKTSLPAGTALATRTTTAEMDHAIRLEASTGAIESVDVRRLMHVLLERKWQILIVVMLVVVPATISTMRQERLYRSSALIEVAAEPVQVLPYRDVATPSAAASFNVTAELTRERERILGSVMVSRVAERLQAHPDAAALAPELGRLRGHVSVTPMPNSRMIGVSYLAWRPDVAATIANVWADEFVKANYDARQEMRLKARQLLERELASLQQQVQASERSLVSYAQAHGLDPAEATLGSNDLAQVKLSTLAASVTAADAAVIAARSRLQTLESASVENFPDDLMTETIGGRQSALLQLEHDLTGLTSTFGPNWRVVVQKRNEVALVREQLEREKSAAITSARQQAMLELQQAEATRQMLGREKAGQEKVVARQQHAAIEYSNLRREVQTNEKLYDGLLERLKQTEVTPGMEFENVRVVEPAQIRWAVAQPRVVWNLFLASVLGLGLGLCVAFGLDFWNDAISNAEEAERLTQFPVLGTIPLLATPLQRVPRWMRGAAGQVRGSLHNAGMAPDTRPVNSLSPIESEPAAAMNLTVLTSAGGAFDEPAAKAAPTDDRHFRGQGNPSEAVRSICASILLSRSDHAPKTLLVTSALPGEGKTTVARQLGRAFADTGCRTLLVECDLRRPTFAQTLGVGTEGGLSLFLAGHIDRPVLHQVTGDHLAVITAGPSAPNPIALLHSERMRTFLAEMTRSFQFVILDAPPVLPIADARMLGALSEGTVLVVRAGKTSRRDVQRACTALDHRLLGLVLNGARRTGSEAGYYQEYLDYREA